MACCSVSPLNVTLKHAPPHTVEAFLLPPLDGPDTGKETENGSAFVFGEDPHKYGEVTLPDEQANPAAAATLICSSACASTAPLIQHARKSILERTEIIGVMPLSSDTIMCLGASSAGWWRWGSSASTSST